jgi:hypothetical protein
MTTTQIPDIAGAKHSGRKAFARGIDCIPSRDQEFIATFAGRAVGDPRTIPELHAWRTGWHQQACTAGPIVAGLESPTAFPTHFTRAEIIETKTFVAVLAMNATSFGNASALLVRETDGDRWHAIETLRPCL